MAKKPIPITTVSQVREILRELFRKRLGYRFKPGNDYFLYELWSMDSPPDVLENTSMADRLDDILGFHLGEEELMTAYDGPISVSSVYLFNLYSETMKEDEIVEPRKEEPKKVRRKRKKLPTKA
jgi:hypothetical protein